MGHQRGWQIQYNWYFGKDRKKSAALYLLKKAAFNEKEAQRVNSKLVCLPLSVWPNSKENL